MPPTLLVYGVCVCVCWVLECVTSIHLPSPNPLQGHWGAGAYPSSLGASGSGVDSSLAYHSHVERQTSDRKTVMVTTRNRTGCNYSVRQQWSPVVHLVAQILDQLPVQYMKSKYSSSYSV